MNGKKRKNKKMALDSDKDSHFLKSDFGINHFNMNKFFNLKI